jgi:ABC-2 type transport system permease protein
MKIRKLEKYTTAFSNSWQGQFEYRFDTFNRFLIAFISLVSIFYLWNNVYGTSDSINGFTKQQLITYYIIVGYLFSSIACTTPIPDEIISGTITSFITKPINYLLYHYFVTLAKRILRLVLGLPIVILIFYCLREQVYFVSDLQSYILLLLTCFGAINIIYLIDVLLAALEFWYLYGASSIGMITDVIMSFFSGALIPLLFLPGPFQTLADYLPFKYTNYFIVNAFMGKISNKEIFLGLMIQLVWTLALLFLVKLVWRAGLKRYEAYGG